MFQLQVELVNVLVVIQLLVSCRPSPDNSCSSDSTGMQVSLTSQRNSKGNWITQVDLERKGRAKLVEAMETDVWSLDMNSSTTTCKGYRPSLHVTLIMKSPSPQARTDYEQFSDIGFYKFHIVATTWPLARKICEDEDAHLIIINSEKEANVANTFFNRHSNSTGVTDSNYMWVGVERKAGDYVTIYGDALNSTGFIRWDSGQPDEQNDADCLLISRPTRGLHDGKCNTLKVPFICEYEL